MKKVFSKALALLMVLSLVLAGGAGFAGAAEEQSIVWLSQGVGEDAWEGLTRPILERYYEETGVRVIGEFYSFNDLFEVIEVKIASGSKDYDVISVDVPMVAAYATRGYLSPMDEYYTDEEKAGFISSAVDAGTWDGVFYAPPENTSTQALWYNKDLLAEAGIELRESSVDNRLTYEELEEYARQALAVLDPDGTNGIHGILFQQVSRTYQMCALANSKGEKSIGDDGFQVDGVINTQGWVDAFTWYQNLHNEGLALRGTTADESSDYFKAGKVLFMIGGTWTRSDAESVGMNYGYAPVPAFEGFEDKVGTATGSWHFGINKPSEKQQLAADFIKWMTLGEGNTMWLEINSDVPSTMSAIEALQSDPEGDPLMAIAAYEAENTSVPRALTPGYPEYSSIMDATFEDIRNGSDVKGSLDNAVEQINGALAKYK